MMAPAMAANSRPPTRRSTSNGSPRWPPWSATAASTTSALRRDHRCVGARARPDPVGTLAAIEHRRRWRPRPSNRRRRDRRGREGRCRRPPPPCRRPWSRRSRVSSRAASPGDVGGRQMEREVEDLQPEIVRQADLVDRRAAGRAKLDRPRGRLDRTRRDVLRRRRRGCRRRSQPVGG